MAQMASKWFSLHQRICVSDKISYGPTVFQEILQKLCYAWEICLIWPRSLKGHN